MISDGGQKPIILTHRGLDPLRGDFPWYESTIEAFEAHLARGYGIEFDVLPLQSGDLLVSHERTTQGLTGGNDSRPLYSLTMSEIEELPTARGRLASLRSILALVERFAPALVAIHVKGPFQADEILRRLVAEILAFPRIHDSLLVFDLTPSRAELLKNLLPNVALGASVAHPYDIQRYNPCVHYTLLSLSECLRYRALFSWAWLDEWDTTSPAGDRKTLYTPQVIDQLRRHGVSIACVSPELHATSPGLLGSESHPDGACVSTVERRWMEMLRAGVDAVCTDFPDRLARLASPQTPSTFAESAIHPQGNF